MNRILDAAQQLIASHPERAEPGSGWPCTEWVALVLARASSLEGWFRRGADWWKRANIWDPEAPYSDLDAAAEVVIEYSGETPTSIVLHRPSLAELEELVGQMEARGGWWVVQGWRRLLPDGSADPSDEGSGHSFLVEVLEGGQARVLESSVDRGVRLAGVSWVGGELLALGAPPEALAARLAPYTAGVGVVPLWGAPR